MSAKDNIIKLWKENRPDIKTIAELERKMNLSNGIINQWAESVPSTRSAKKVADYFGVPMSKVLGDVDDNSVQLGEDEQRVVTLFRKNTAGLSPAEKDAFNSSLDGLMNAAKNIINKED
ncbi:XRE family transcriptional regulator [Jeotgalibaca porci]|uniref:XRE family transcriptional regulator n=1 Tax=Jeotgalibaca porci TaxID=1868793 RepID=UPI0035A0E74E